MLTMPPTIPPSSTPSPPSKHKYLGIVGVFVGFVVLMMIAIALFIYAVAVIYVPVSAKPAEQMVAVPLNPALPEKKLLFVGNSYTYSHQMPMMVQNMLNSIPSRMYNYRVDMVAVPKANLQQHLENNVVIPQLQKTKYEVVFLQEQSTTAFYKNEALVSEVMMAHFIKAAKESGARVIIFSPWPRRADNAFYSGRDYSNLDRPQDPAVMSRGLYNFYERVAEQNQVDHIPLSRYFYAIMRDYPAIDLHAADGTHPTKTGSYFVALSVYRHLVGDVSAQLWRPVGVSAADTGVLVEYLHHPMWMEQIPSY